MKECVIAVIGAGATALSLLDSLVDEARAEPDCPRLVVYLIETRRLRGRGLAYEDDLATNLLNTRAGFITPFPKRPGHFFSWLQENEAAWRHEFPGLVVDAQTFVPRPLFGLYLECMMGELAGELMRIGGTLVPVTAEATDLEPTPEGRVVVHTDTALAIRADRVVLSCGNLQAREEDAVERLPGFFANPYPIRRLAHRIPRDASVAIVGARLSAIDVALGLLSTGHDGPLTMISRSGYLPAVRGTQGRYKPRILTQETIAAHLARHGRVRLAELVRWVEDEIELAGGGRRVEGASFPPEPPPDPLAFLEAEIAAAAHPRPWQAVLYATNGLVDMLWRALPEEERSLFLARFQAAWMAYRVSIPVENARRLLAAGWAGRLAFRSGESVVAPGEGGGFSLRIGRDGAAEAFDAVVCAYGSPRDPRRLDSRLVGNILARGLARPHRHGGLDVVPESGRLIEADGTEGLAISALGELTAGVHFFTSALEINARHAAAQARSLVHGIVHAPRELAAPLAPAVPPRSRVLVEAV